MPAVSTSVMIGAIVTYLGNKLAKNESVNSFFDDFSEATVNWIKPLFIEEDDTPTREIAKLQEKPDSDIKRDSVKNLLASELEDKPEVEKYIKEIFEKISQTEEGKTIISNSKNVVTGNVNTGGGDFRVGDNITNEAPNTSDVKGNNNIVIQDVKSGGDTNIDINKNTWMDANITILTRIKSNNISIDVQISNINSGQDTDIVIQDYFHNSPDYQRLLQRIEKQREKVRALSEKGGEAHHYEAKILAELEKTEKEFKVGALHLAETFLKIEIRTERLRQAKAFFEQGEIIKADNILVEADLINDQDALIAQMDYLQKRKTHILDTIQNLNLN